MIKKILSSVLLVVFVVGGAVAGDFVKNSKSKSDSHAGDTEKKKDAKSKDKKKKDDKKGKDKAEKGKDSLGSGPAYLKFKRQFVVPVMDAGEISALVIMNLNYELDEDAPSNMYSYEPKLRDAIMRELLALSGQDIFGEDLTTAQNYEFLRTTLLRAGQAVVPDGIRDVLILDIARQEQ